MADAGGALTDYDLGVWSLERQKQLPDPKARAEDRLLRVIAHLQTARSVVAHKDLAIRNLKDQVKLYDKTSWRLRSELAAARTEIARLSPPAPPAVPPRRRKAGAR